MAIKIGLTESQTKTVADELTKLLADTYFLYLKTQNFHWNVKSVHFHSLHLMFEGQYEELSDAVDLIAERIRALGQPTPASFKQFSKLTDIKEATEVPSGTQMVAQLLEDHETICRHLRTSLKIVQKANDEGTADLMIARLQAHEKTAWMLRSTSDK
jgi:starvation-inducible DNA-binding protein